VRYTVFVALTALFALFAASPTEADVRKTRLTASVEAGGVASLTVRVSPKARCVIVLPAGTASTAGLSARTGSQITWRWRIRETAKIGPIPIAVKCGESGSLRTKMRILAPVPSLTVEEATRIVCARLPERVQATYGVEFVPRPSYSTERSCQFLVNFPAIDFNALYHVKLEAAPTPCTFRVIGHLDVLNDNNTPPEYRGPFDREITETCKSLR
jgi:hypothetical protein